MIHKTFTALLLLAGANLAIHGQSPKRQTVRTWDREPVQQIEYQETSAPINGMDCCEPTPGTRIWASADYLNWRLRKGNTPPLVTTGNSLDAVPGAIGQPGTRVLFGGEEALTKDSFNGWRGTVGAQLNDCWGVELSGFATEERSTGFSVASDPLGNPGIYIPFFRPATNAIGAAGEASYTVADPNFLNLGITLDGNVGITSSTRLWGAEANAVRRLSTSCNSKANLLVGFRYLDLEESLDLFGVSNFPAIPSTQRFQESFDTRNKFYGGQVGGEVSWSRGRLSLDVIGKVALGVTQQRVSVAGSVTDTLLAPAGLPQGVVFVQPSNVGTSTTDKFTWVPHVQAKVGYNILDNVRATVGYDFLYWSSVARVGDQIDRRDNDTQQLGGGLGGGPALPAREVKNNAFFAHGLSLGLEIKY